MTNDTASVDLVALTGDIVQAYVTNNSVPVAELPALIASIHASLLGAGTPAVAVQEKPTPPVPVRKTVTPDAIISLEDGKPYKTLKRHLAGRGMTPEEYRKKWDLPHDYPMVAASYASQRSELAKASGLGARRRGAGLSRAA